MEFIEFTLDDGTALLVIDPADPAADSAEVLSPSWEYLTDAILSGVSVQMSWATLKGVANRVRTGGILGSKKDLDATDITEAIKDHLMSTGYGKIEFTEVEKVAEEGWKIAGTADGRTFTAKADPSGRVVHVKVDN